VTVHACSFAALGTTAEVVVSHDGVLACARRLLADELAALDRLCSRFRPDSELSRANAAAGEAVRVSSRLAELVGVALRVAAMTEGRVDPTLGAELARAGYDRPLVHVGARGTWTVERSRPAPRWQAVELDPRLRTLRTPPGVSLDLAATAKAWAADRAAARIAAATGDGVLVSLGGDIAVAGTPPAGGWPVRVAEDHRRPPDGAGPVVAIAAGGLATSTTTVRRWPTSEGEAHHLLDPATGEPLHSIWRTATVAAATCVDANAAALAALVASADARAWLEARALPARLVAVDGHVLAVGGWPCEAAAA
jgi:thiamine biosynthesis lipoprotein